MKALDTFLSLAAIEPFHYEKKNFSAVHDNANPMSADDNGNSHPLLFTSSTLVSSVADANGLVSECHPSLLEDGRVVTDEDEVNTDEREENKPSPYGEDGQLPDDYLKQLDEHYANLLPEADQPYSTSNDVTLGDTPSIPSNPKGVRILLQYQLLPLGCVLTPSGNTSDILSS